MKKNLVLSITSISSMLAIVPLATVSCGNTLTSSEEKPVVTPEQKPSEPTTPSTKPEQKPVDPVAPSTKPEVKPVEPTTPSTKPEQKPVDPTIPSTKPEVKPVEPVVPSTKPGTSISSVKIISNKDKFEVQITGENLSQNNSNYIFTNDKLGTKYMNLDQSKSNSSNIVLYTEDFAFQNKTWKVEMKNNQTSSWTNLGTLTFSDMIIEQNLNQYVKYLYNGVINYNKSLKESMTTYKRYEEIYHLLSSPENKITKLNNNISIVTNNIEVNYNNISNNSSTFEYSVYFSINYRIMQNGKVLEGFNYIYNNPNLINDAISNWEYVTNDGIVIKDNKIIGYRGTSKEINIQEKYEIVNEYGRFVTDTITEIADGAFENKGLSKVNLARTITKIGNRAFKDNYIGSISFFSSLASIGESCFENNWILEVDFRNTKISHIPNNAFANNRLCEVYWDNTIKSLGEGSFQNNYISRIDFRPTWIKTISKNAFYHNLIEDLNWDSKIFVVEESAFDTNRLKTVDFSKTNIRTVSKKSFRNNWIENVEISSIQTIEDYAFESNRIKSLNFNNAINLSSIGIGSFKTNKIQSINWNQKITNVPSEAFMYNNLTNDNLNLVNTKIENIGEFAFGYNDLQFNINGEKPENIIHLPESIRIIEKGAFQSKEIFITVFDQGSKLEYNLFDINGNADKFWNQVITINRLSATHVLYPNASWYKEHWNKWSFNWYLMDTNGKGRLL